MAPTVRTSNGQVQPSLAKLQSLDKDYKDINERLLAAAKLAGIPIGDDTGKASKPRNFGHSRAEFVLKWIVERLGSKDQDLSKALRLLPASWQLLKSLVEVLPKAIVARLLTAGNIWTIVQSSLTDIAGSSVAVNSVERLDLTNGFPQERNSRKRKRGPDAEVTSNKKDDGQRRVFESGVCMALAEFLHSIVPADHQQWEAVDSVEEEHLRSILRISAEDAASLLASVLGLLQRQLHSNAPLSRSIYTACIQVWSSRAIQAADELGSSATAFSEQCLTPVVHLYGSLGRAEGRDWAQEETVRFLRDEVEKLLQEHILLPAQSSFTRYQEQRDAAKTMKLFSAAALLKPLQDLMKRALESDEQGLRESVLGAIPSIFSLAARKSRRANPKQKQTSSLWLKALFEILATCGGEEMLNDSVFGFDNSVRLQPGSSHSPLEGMLSVAKQYRITFSPETMSVLLHRHTGLMQPPSATTSPRWSIVEKILEVDKGLFTTKHDGESARMAALGGLSCRDEIFQHLTALRWGDDGTSQQTSWRRADFVTRIVTHLMSAFVEVRDLPAFLTLWYKHLLPRVDDIAGPDKGPIVWTSDILLQSTASKVRESFTAQQVKSILATFLMPISSFARELELSSEMAVDVSTTSGLDSVDAVTDFCTAIVVTEAIVGGIKGEDTIKLVEAELTQLISYLRGFLCSGLQLAGLEARTWRLLTRLHIIQGYVSNPKDVLTQGKELLDGDLMSNALAKASVVSDDVSVETAFYAFGYIINLAKTLPDDVSVTDKLNTIIKESSDGFLSFCSQVYAAAEESNTPVWSAIDERLGSYLGLLRSNSKELLRLDSKRRNRIFSYSLCWPVLFPPDKAPNKTSQSLQQHVAGLQEAVLGLGDYALFSDWVTALLHGLGLASAENVGAPQKQIALSVKYLLLALPTESLSKKSRDEITDKLLKEVHWEDEQESIITLTLLLRFARGGRVPAGLVATPLVLLRLRDIIDGHANADALCLLDRLVGITLGHVASLADTDAASAYFMTLDESVLKICRKHDRKAVAYNDVPGAMSIIKHRLFLHDTKARAVDKSFLGITLELLAGDIDRIRKLSLGDDGSYTSTLSEELLLDVAALLFDFTEDKKQAKKISSALANMGTADTSASKDTSQAAEEQWRCSIGRIWRSKAVSITSSKHSLEPETFLHQAAASSIPPPQLLVSIQPQLDQLYSSQPRNEQILSLLSALNGVLQTSHDPRLLVLRSGLITSLTDTDLSDATRSTARSLLPLLAAHLRSAQSAPQVGHALHDILYILRKKPFMASQFGIESVLDALHSLHTPGGYQFLRPVAASVYAESTAIVNTLLLLHRRALGGRMHLLIPLLQALLNGLFTPSTGASNVARAQRPPSWMPTRPHALSASHAVGYVRILLTLTQPTVSGASQTATASAPGHGGSRGNALLTDTTRAARKYAARFVPYVLTQLCALQLVGSMAPQVRQAVMPGVWACVEAVGREELRGMSSAMGRDERAIWGALWQEWVRSRGR